MLRKTIATHSGTFHADESLACWMLKGLEEFKNGNIVRTRDPDAINAADIVVDVGGIYDAAKNRFDHHQRGFTETFDEHHAIKLSSAGLVYKHFGKRVIANILNWDNNHKDLEYLYGRVYDDLIEGFDGVDNGVPRYPQDIKAAYRDSTSISSRVSRLNPRWNEETNDEILMRQFLKAVEITGQELVATVENIALSSIPARDITLRAFSGRKDVHPSGKILILDQYCPFKTHLLELENEAAMAPTELPLYVLFQDTSTNWRVQAIPISPDSFLSRKAMPEPWRGLRDEELSRLTGIDGCVFIHASGFTGGAKSKESALKLALLALEHKDD